MLTSISARVARLAPRFALRLQSRFRSPVLCAVAGAALLCGAAQAQLRLTEPDENWTEDQVPAPPAFKTSQLVKVEGPISSSLSFGIDPDTVTIGKDQVVRYVLVMQGPSATTVVYEGLRCSTGEKRVYARRNGDSDWETVKEGWMPLNQSSASRYAWNMARDGVCIGTAANNSPRDIVRDLKSPKGTLYR